jgi:hypothetical protein
MMKKPQEEAQRTALCTDKGKGKEKRKRSVVGEGEQGAGKKMMAGRNIYGEGTNGRRELSIRCPFRLHNRHCLRSVHRAGPKGAHEGLKLLRT